MASDDRPKSSGRTLDNTGETVRENIRRIRDDVRGLSQAALSERLRDLGRPIPPLGIHRIENGDRRVDVDDLIAIAVALDVSPISMLTPNASDRAESVAITAVEGALTAEQLWKWLCAERPLRHVTDGMELLEFIRAATPLWRSRQYADGVLHLLELNRIEKAMNSDDQEVAADARRRFEEIRAKYDGDD
ncbi:helix-turn-helix domain-containing protein [Mycobacterium sp. smrl_JER01]|uniref:helix-turn-helix domain-containing protein n=1 Tax=Mycobacterium sp. smrl_JER01 TaxID=3402633 RepID=UPI003AC86FEB